MGYLDFDVRALGPLVNHVKAAPERLPSFPYNTDSSLLAKGATLTAEEAEIGASGAKVDGHKVPAHLILARDAGVYLMSAGYPELLVEGGREPHLVHARNLTPDGDWVTAADAAVGHKDFAIGLPLDWFEAAIEGGLDTLTLNVTEAAVNPVITGDWRRKSRVPRVLTVRRKPAATEASGGQATPNDSATLYRQGLVACEQGDPAGGRTAFAAAAEMGHARAGYQLGRMLARGEGGAASASQALIVLKKAADGGAEEAACVLAALEQSGAMPDMEALKGAAAAGDSSAQLRLGLHYSYGLSDEPDMKEAVKWIRKAAQQGETEAQAMLGNLYRRGVGVALDAERGGKWTLLAAGQGHPQAMAVAGLMYTDGIGVTADWSEAANWLRKAAESGHGPSAFRLGTLYEAGRGVTTDTNEAFCWYRKAAEAGESEASRALADLIATGQAGEQSPAAALPWYKKAAAAGDVEAGELMTLIERGIAEGRIESSKAPELGPDPDSLEGESRLKALNKRGHTRAHTGDLDGAAADFAVAAKAGYSSAQHNLAMLYFDGAGVKRDGQACIDWLYRAASQGHTGSLRALAEMHARGILLPLDPARAASLYLRAAGLAAGIVAKLDPEKMRSKTGSDLAHAMACLNIAAREGGQAAQLDLAILLAEGIGSDPDPFSAYAWAKLAAQKLEDETRSRAEELVEMMAGNLSSEERETADVAIENWQPSTT